MQEQRPWTAPGSRAPEPPAATNHGRFVPLPQHPYRPVHKPGIVALRPLGLGDMYDGAFNAIRRNPAPMVGLAALVSTAALVLPAAVTLLLARSGDLQLSLEEDMDAATAVTYFGALMSALVGVVLAGMVVHVVVAATLGRKATIEDTWRATRGRFLHLVALSLLSVLLVVVVLALPIGLGLLAGATVAVPLGVLVGLSGFAAGVCLLVFLWTRVVILAAPSLVIERLSLVGAVRRAWELSRGQFWRIFGIALLTAVIASTVSQVLTIPFMVGSLAALLIDDPTVAALVYVFANYLALILSQALSIPFTAAVSGLQYVDQRIRKEGYDVELIARATGERP